MFCGYCLPYILRSATYAINKSRSHGIILEILLFIATGFWIWMSIDCYKNESNQLIWFWIVLLLYVPGALIYFFNRNPVPLFKGDLGGFITYDCTNKTFQTPSHANYVRS
jgi:hypothetical protein